MTLKYGVESSEYFNLCRPGWQAGVSKMRSHGYEGMDLRDFIRTETDLFTCPFSEFEKRLLDLRSVASDEGIEISQCHGPWRWPVNDSGEALVERFEKMARSVRGASILGCKYIAQHPIMPFGIGSHTEDEKKKVIDINLEFYSKLDMIGREYGVTVCIENMPFLDYPLAATADVLSLIKEIDSANTRFCFDSGHSAVFCADNVADDIRLAGKEYLAIVHLHDNYGKRDEHNYPYNGIINWDAVTHALAEVNYSGLINLETFVVGKYPSHIRDHMQLGIAKIAKHLSELVDAKKSALGI